MHSQKGKKDKPRTSEEITWVYVANQNIDRAHTKHLRHVQSTRRRITKQSAIRDGRINNKSTTIRPKATHQTNMLKGEEQSKINTLLAIVITYNFLLYN
jgi:hypothetical protein